MWSWIRKLHKTIQENYVWDESHIMPAFPLSRSIDVLCSIFTRWTVNGERRSWISKSSKPLLDGVLYLGSLGWIPYYVCISFVHKCYAGYSQDGLWMEKGGHELVKSSKPLLDGVHYLGSLGSIPYYTCICFVQKYRYVIQHVRKMICEWRKVVMS